MPTIKEFFTKLFSGDETKVKKQTTPPPKVTVGRRAPKPIRNDEQFQSVMKQQLQREALEEERKRAEEKVAQQKAQDEKNLQAVIEEAERKETEKKAVIQRALQMHEEALNTPSPTQPPTAKVEPPKQPEYVEPSSSVSTKSTKPCRQYTLISIEEALKRAQNGEFIHTSSVQPPIISMNRESQIKPKKGLTFEEIESLQKKSTLAEEKQKARAEKKRLADAEKAKQAADEAKFQEFLKHDTRKMEGTVLQPQVGFFSDKDTTKPRCEGKESDTEMTKKSHP